ncbi:SPOR domain-containing protein [Limnobacter parvus]|uniref:SPOR domain-containing protein n=1 Tax=Limnobacter parvus TaxID=2939690 RepID=A0ABT1XHQ7_9BURK|nr:SPOR domain-containing protein [Limnobacter parvus]
MSSNSRSTAKNKVNNDPVDELKRRSRRRLVGSIALFLAAIIIVPALVENEPAQTPSDVELVVPERPSIESPKEAPVAQPTLEAPVAAQEQAVASAPVAPAIEPQAKLEPKVEVKPEPKVEPKVEPKPEPKPEVKVEPKVETKPAGEDPIAAFAKAEVYWVQVAAVSDKARADTLSTELSGKGFPAKVESTSTANGTVYRVRVGPIAGQSKADETKSKLSAAGYTAGRVVQ